MRSNPHLYEINTRLFLGRLSVKYGRGLTLAEIPEAEWQSIAAKGFDLVWLMGAWQRSDAARQQALLNADLREKYDEVLPGWGDDDVAGSPYAIYRYELDTLLGDNESGLAELKTELNRQGLGLVLDFVPNHFAKDTPWVASHPNWFVQGSRAERTQHPDWFFTPDGIHHFAHGRDPNFPPWTDTVQVNFFSKELRQSLVIKLLKIAEVAHGVRCDMAMLALNDVFERVWGEVARGYPRPDVEFWSAAIRIVKQQYPDFIFIAETYWGLEAKLLELGFDYVYDKTLYDKLWSPSTMDVRDYLTASTVPLERTVHFIENHDEPRAAAAFGRERSLAAAVIVATVPGLRLFHDGQIEGKRVHLPVQLVSEPADDSDEEVQHFYETLLVAGNVVAFHEGDWELLPVDEAWEGNPSHQSLLAWSWRYARELKVVTVNYAPHQSQGRLRLPVWLPHGMRVAYRDELTGVEYEADSEEISSLGLYVDLGPWRAHVFDMFISELL